MNQNKFQFLFQRTGYNNNKKMQQLQSFKTLISKWKLNMPLLAAKMRMPVSTFKNKLDPNQPQYHFSESETQTLKTVLAELKKDIDKV
jgi:hypothetical protein